MTSKRTTQLDKCYCQLCYWIHIVELDTTVEYLLKRIVNMESTDLSNWTNGSRFSQNVSNYSFDFSKDTPVANMNGINITLLTFCLLGLPGNLLVIAVYMRNMTSSLKIYMFALAIADSAICVCVVIFVQMPKSTFANYAMHVFNVAVFFSMFLLVFVAIERLMAILLPHSFNLNPRRAWKALLMIVAATVVFVISLFVIRERQQLRIHREIKVGVSIVGVLTITICYTIIAVALLARARTARKRVSTFNPTTSPKLRSSQFQKVTPITSVENLKSGQNPTASTSRDTSDTTRPYQRTEHLDCPGTASVTRSASVVPTKKSTPTQSRACKNVSLLFVITVVFIACWLPFWLHSMGVPIVLNSDRLFVANSVVNPFIYGVASAMFREDVRQFYRQTRVKLSTCYN